ncbi:MAG: hypothetical protein M3093_05160 [Thermoproteota archaeon]|nr:hypothetical protein [Thermoproteota archaeon]
MVDKTKETVDATNHTPSYDTSQINRAVERASRDADFVNRAVTHLEGLRFPAFKHNILEHIIKGNINKVGDEKEDVVALFESLDGYIEFRDQYHVQKAIEENNPTKKKDYQITESKRESPDVRIRQTYADASIKDREAVSEREERKDYPEVTPTAMTNFICDNCHKAFQNQQDLIQHKQFESGTSAK